MKGYKGLRGLRFEAYFASMPLHAWMLRGRKTRRAYLHLKESQNYSKKQINDLQLERLQKIGKMYQDGLLTKEEFEAEKKKILSEKYK